MAATTRTVSVALSAKIAGYVTNMRQAAQATSQVSKELVTLDATSKEKFSAVSKYATGAGLGLLAFAAYAVKASYDFDKAMSEVQAVSDASTKQMGQLRQAAIDAGKATIYSATEAAQAEAELAKAGLSTTQILNGGLTGALSLASAGTLSLTDAATDTAQALNIFGLQGDKASHVADLLAEGANTSAADVSQLAYALRQSGLVAHQTGMSIEQTTGVLALFAQNGLVGSDAGTSFKVMLQALQAPSKKTRALMDELGISAYDTQGNFIGITGVAQNLQDKLAGLTQAQRAYALAQIFGSDGVRSATILYQQGAAGVQQWIDKVNVSGAAATTAKTKLNNLAGDVENLKGSIETLGIAAGGGATKGLRFMAQGANDLVNVLIKMPAPISETLTILSGGAGTLLLAATGFVKARAATQNFITTLEDMGPAGAKMASGLKSFTGMLPKLGLAAVGVGAFYYGFKALVDLAEKHSGPVKHDVDQLAASIANFGATGQASGELAATFGHNLAGLDKDITSLRTAQTELNKLAGSYRGLQLSSAPNSLHTGALAPNPQYASIATQQAQQVQDFKDTDAALAKLVQGGDSLQALSFFENINGAMTAQGFSLAQINKEFPQYTQATQAAEQANIAAAAGAGQLASQTDTVGLSMQDEIDKGIKLKDVLDSLSGAAEDSAKAHIDAEQAMADLIKTTDKGTKTLNENKQAGRDHANAVLNSIDKAKAQFQATYSNEVATKGETTALQDANAEYDKYIAKLKKTLIHEGYNKTEVDALVGAWSKLPPVIHKVPPKTDVGVDAPGLPKVQTQLDHVQDTINRISGTHTADVVVHVSKNQLAEVNRQLSRYAGSPNRWGGVYTHAATGLVNAGVYSPQSPARYAFAEPQTGGEAFVPRYGNYARSTQILDTAARWYGGRFAPAGSYSMGGGGGTTHTYAPTTNVYPQRADLSIQDLAALQARQEALYRVGRPR